ncbi:MAG: homocysteine S-methyltransferase family protein [Pseudomonadota bacterium]|nr:homocysteine S-methyltransferase family protein [Pseudomonadota bacterium]
MTLEDRLRNNEIVILDGAIGSEIERLGAKMDNAAWCGVANKTYPDTVRNVHEEYVRAGADVITANTFSTCRHVLAGAGLADEAAQITAKAVEIAREAIDKVAPDCNVAVAGSTSNNTAWIPGSVTPDPRFLPSPGEEAANYREWAEALASAGADLIILEMMADIPRASMVAEAALRTGLPLWIGMSCCLTTEKTLAAWDFHLAERPEVLHASHVPGEIQPVGPLIDAMASFKPQVMGMMHSAVEAMVPGTEAIKERWSGPLMGYAEATGDHYVKPDDFALHCRSLVKQGVQILGGCCGTTIEHIRAMTSAVSGDISSRSI